MGRPGNDRNWIAEGRDGRRQLGESRWEIVEFLAQSGGSISSVARLGRRRVPTQFDPARTPPLAAVLVLHASGNLVPPLVRPFLCMNSI